MMLIVWLISIVKKDAGIVDPFWGIGFALVAWVVFAQAESSSRMYLLCAMVTIWAIRLSGYLFVRNLGHQEDSRYAAMREKHGKKFWWVSLLTVFLLQGTLLWFISFPVIVAGVSSADCPLTWLDLVGFVVWLIGWLFEAIADWQLAVFKSNPENKGQVLDKGLWRFSRHPNYFGNFLIWWGIFIVSISAFGWTTIASPLLMSFLLLKVSGVAMLEKTIGDRRPGYREYCMRTNAFFPGPVKSPKK